MTEPERLSRDVDAHVPRDETGPGRPGHPAFVGRRRRREEVASALGYASFAAFILERHRRDRRSVSDISLETGLSRRSIYEGLGDLPPRPLPGVVPDPPPRRRPAAPRSASPDRPADPGRSLTTGEVARLVGVDVRTVLRVIRAGGLPAWRTPGGHFRVNPEDAAGFARSLNVVTSAGSQR